MFAPGLSHSPTRFFTGEPLSGAGQNYVSTLQSLVSYGGSTAIFNAYRRELERLLQWSWHIQQTLIQRLTREDIVQHIMLFAHTTHFVRLSQAILYRGAGFDGVWPSMLAIIVIGAVYFLIALSMFRRCMASANEG